MVIMMGGRFLLQMFKEAIKAGSGGLIGWRPRGLGAADPVRSAAAGSGSCDACLIK